MDKKITIIGIGGSLSPKSSSLAALKTALAGAADVGAEIKLFDIRSLALPMYDPEYTSAPESAAMLAEAVYNANGLLWSSPMYHGTVSGSFKNALDWLELLSDRKPLYLTNKVVGLISTAGGVQGLQAVNTMEFIVRSLRGWAVPLVLPIPHAWQVFDADGRPKDAKIEEQLKALGKEVCRAAHQFAHEGKCDYELTEHK
jgi:FMN reductase